MKEDELKKFFAKGQAAQRAIDKILAVKSTPTPWRSINGAIFDTAFTTNHIRKAIAVCGEKESTEESKANASFIVRAVNEYEKLLKENITLRIQREKLLEILGTAKDVVDAYQNGTHVGTRIIYLEQAIQRFYGRIQNQAIAQTEKETL